MNLKTKKLLEELLADIQACKMGTVPTGATLGNMERRVKEALQEPETKPNPPPRYDDVFAEGVRWLDENG